MTAADRSTVEELWALIQEQRDRLDTQAADIAALKAQLRSDPPGSGESPAGDSEPRQTTRRDMLKTAAMGAIGVMGAGTLLEATAGATAASGAQPPTTFESASGATPAVTADNTATSGSAEGVFAQTFSTSGIAVFGKASATSGHTSGVQGVSASDAGAGVFGNSTATSGNGIGVVGEAASASGVGVQGSNSSTAGGFGIQGLSASGSGIGLVGKNTATSGQATGIEGSTASPAGVGVLGVNPATSDVGRGVHGQSSSPKGFGVEGLNLNTPTTGGTGVIGTCLSPTASGSIGVSGIAETGVQGTSTVDSGAGVLGTNSANAPGVHGVSTTNSGGVGVLGDARTGGGFGVLCAGNFSVTGGQKNALIPFPDGSHRAVYCMESPECWFEDFGSAELVNGTAMVYIDPGFAHTIHTDEYHVFLTPHDDSKGLYVTDLGPKGFRVREQQAGRSNLRFSYRIVGRRKDLESPRLKKVQLPPVLERSGGASGAQ